MQIQSQKKPNFTKDLCTVIAGDQEGKLTGLGKTLDELSQGKLTELAHHGYFPEKLGEFILLPILPNIEGQVLWVNCGKNYQLNNRQYQQMIQKIADFFAQSKLPQLYLSLVNDVTVDNKDNAWKTFHAAQIIASKPYRFKKNADNKIPEKILMIESTETDSIQQAQAYVKALDLVKELANTPANICTPDYLAKTATKLSSDFPRLKAEILEEADMKKIGMNTLLSVSQGSQNPAKLICLHHHGSKNASDKPIIFIGKGITFDTGGTCLKPGPGMDEMKYDMCGAATVLGLMQIVAELNLPLNIIGLAPCAENMPGSKASRPGDIVTSLSGKTIEILNTDAEGRLILCDTLTYAEKFSPKAVIDLATLTGAAIMTFGHLCNALMGNDQDLVNALLSSSEECNERTWQLPLWQEYQEMLTSNFADLPNIHNDNGAKTIIAGCFLSQFAQAYPWAHLDIAGTAWQSGKDKGATGRPLLLLLTYLLGLSNQ